MRLAYAVVFAGLFIAESAAAQACASWRPTVAGTPLELAPPQGYTETCTQDVALCHTLTSGFPPSVTTVGYFVPTDEWSAYQRRETTGFRRYLIAQVAAR